MVPEIINETNSEIPIVGLDHVFDLLVEKCEFLVHRLRDFVAFPTVSSDPSKKANIQEMAEYLVEVLKKFGLTASMVPMTFEDVQTGDPSPPLVLAESGLDPTKRTVCFYGHFDVRPLTPQDYWYSDPFVLTCNNDGNVFYGKGSSMGKGPLLCLINAIGAYQQLRIALPINIKIIADPMGLSDEDLTGKFLKKTSLEFFNNVDFVCMCVGQWFGNCKPSISHGSRGLCYFSMEIEGSSKDLHSGNYGGLLNEPMSDLVYMMDQLVDRRGTIKINDLYQDVIPVTKEEKDYYKTIQFVVRDFKKDLRARELLANEDKQSLLMNLWRKPSLTIHGIEGAFSGPHIKNVIPSKVIGKFSINIVPNMTPSKVKKKVFDYLSKMWKTRKSTNKIKVQMKVGKLAWYTDPKDVNCIAAVNAVKRVYDEEPELVRNANRVRIANALRRVTNASVIAIPVAKANDVSDTNAEKIDLVNYINGCKTFAAYFHEISTLSPKVIPQEMPVCSCKTTGLLAECNCYMKASWMVEEDEEEEEQQLLTLEDSVSITSYETSSSSALERGEKPASTRFYGHSLHVKKKIEVLKNIIAEGESVIGSKYTKDVVDTEEQIGEEGSDSGHQPEATPQAQSATPFEKLTRAEPSEHSFSSSGVGKLVRLSQVDTSMLADSSYFSKPKARKLESLDQSSSKKFGLQTPTKSSSRQSNLGLHKLGYIPTELMETGQVSVPPEDKKLPKDRKIGERSGVIQGGYVGKPPFGLNIMNSKQLHDEPFGIISSLSALLYKRRILKMESASVKTLPGSKLIPSSTYNPQGSISTLKFSSSAQVTALPKSTSKVHNVDKSANDGSRVTASSTFNPQGSSNTLKLSSSVQVAALQKSTSKVDKSANNGIESSRVHQVFLKIDQPGSSTNGIPKSESHSSDKLPASIANFVDL